MELSQIFEHYFKPEVRNQGRQLVAKDLVIISHRSDTAVQAFVRGSSSVKVHFSSSTIGSETFQVECSCPASARRQFCKHIWAVLLTAEKLNPDFFEYKKSIEKKLAIAEVENPFKLKQAEYQKAQYQKQKSRAQELKRIQKNKGRTEEPLYPLEVQLAMTFFSLNGFPIEKSFDEEYLKNAKKKLSRIFHPDKGGTHEETVELNEHFDVINEYFLDN